MDEGARKFKGGKRPLGGKAEKSRPRDMYERRPLKTVTLSPPDFHISPHILQGDCVEKEVRFAGIIPDIPVELDTTNRTDVLRVIDRGKREEKIPWRTSHEHDSIFCLSVYNFKLSKRDGKEEVLLRVAIHEIAAVCYIRDDNQHCLAIKFGNREDLEEMCQLAVLYCDSRQSSEELCALIGQCFQLVYTEATMQFLDTKLLEAAHSMSVSSSNITSSTTATSRSEYSNSNRSTPTARRNMYDQQTISFITQSQQDLHFQAGGSNTLGNNSSSSASRSLPTSRRKPSTPSESELSVSASELIQQYMNKLQTKLNVNELRHFAQLLASWHQSMPFSDFCEKVLALYGPDRKHLLAGMRPFITEKDTPYFDTFLDRIGVNPNWNETLSSGVSRRPYRRTLSGNSQYSNNANNVEEVDRMLSNISGDIENLEASVDMNTNPESFLPKTT